MDVEATQENGNVIEVQEEHSSKPEERAIGVQEAEQDSSKGESVRPAAISLHEMETLQTPVKELQVLEPQNFSIEPKKKKKKSHSTSGNDDTERLAKSKKSKLEIRAHVSEGESSTLQQEEPMEVGKKTPRKRCRLQRFRCHKKNKVFEEIPGALILRQKGNQKKASPIRSFVEDITQSLPVNIYVLPRAEAPKTPITTKKQPKIPEQMTNAPTDAYASMRASITVRFLNIILLLNEEIRVRKYSLITCLKMHEYLLIIF